MRESLFDPVTGKLRDPNALKTNPPGVSVRGDTHTRVDEHGAIITRHKDGRQGVTVRPKIGISQVRHGYDR